MDRHLLILYIRWSLKKSGIYNILFSGAQRILEFELQFARTTGDRLKFKLTQTKKDTRKVERRILYIMDRVHETISFLLGPVQLVQRRLRANSEISSLTDGTHIVRIWKQVLVGNGASYSNPFKAPPKRIRGASNVDRTKI